MENWARVTWTEASHILQLMGSKQAGLAETGMPSAYFDSLVEQNHLQDAAMFVGHALPRYECIVWATRVLMEAEAVERRGPMMIAVLRWIDDPNDANRRTAWDLAESEADDTPEKFLATAVFLSGGSISTPELPPVLPPQEVCARLATAGVLTAAFSTENPDQFFRNAASLGTKIASKGLDG